MSVAPRSGVLAYRGHLDLPKKIYVGDNAAFKLDLERVSPKQQSVPKKNPRVRRDKEQLALTLNLSPTDIGGDLELELRGKGCEVDDPKVQQRLGEEILHYFWSCLFPTSAHFTLALIPKVLHSTRSRTFEAVVWKVKVVQFLGFTKQELFLWEVVGGVAGVLSVIVGIVATLSHLFHI